MIGQEVIPLERDIVQISKGYFIELLVSGRSK